MTVRKKRRKNTAKADCIDCTICVHSVNIGWSLQPKGQEQNLFCIVLTVYSDCVHPSHLWWYDYRLLTLIVWNDICMNPVTAAVNEVNRTSWYN